jgi:hypothetical protein
MQTTKLISFPLLQSPVASLMLVRQSGQLPSDVAWEQVTQRLKLCVTFDPAEISRQAEVPIQRMGLSESSAVEHRRELWLALRAAEPVSVRGWGINE